MCVGCNSVLHDPSFDFLSWVCFKEEHINKKSMYNFQQHWRKIMATACAVIALHLRNAIIKHRSHDS